MQHPKHGKYPCTAADIDLFRKSGWTECEPKSVVTAPAPTVTVPSLPEDPQAETELTKDELLELADQSNIEVDRRWGIGRLKEALGL